jgi:predicted Zn-dependent peptidase
LWSEFVPQDVYQHTFPNGLTLLAERMTHVRSAAMNFLIPAGCIYDPDEHLGMATVLTDLIVRGAGRRNSRELSLALDNLGVDRDESVGTINCQFWGATVARNLPAALEIYADILQRPRLPEEEVDPVKALALQDLVSLDDEPKQKVMIELRRHLYPAPLDRDRRGTEEGVRSLTAELLRQHFARVFRPRGTILSVAGNIEWQPLKDQVARLFGDWKNAEEPTLTYGKLPLQFGYIEKDTSQTQIAVAYPSVTINHEDYYAAMGAVNVLSGGMSSRLFTEVREKRGLCYAVWASHTMFKDRANILCYAGTTNERAQKTLDVLLFELERLQEGIEKDEVECIQAGLKSSLIMQEESTSARARSLASDWYYLQRIRSLDEIKSAIDNLSPEGIVDHVRRYPPGDFSIVTLGPTPLRFRLQAPSQI